MASYGKKTRNPGWKTGDGNWAICDTCGFSVRASSIRETWDGLRVCPEDWEPRNTQDFVRSRKDKIVADVIRVEGADIFISPFCTTRTARAGDAIAGCAIAGIEEFVSDEIPAGTFNPNTL